MDDTKENKTEFNVAKLVGGKVVKYLENGDVLEWVTFPNGSGMWVC